MIWGSIRDSSESWWPTCIVMNQMALSLRSFADDLSFPKDCTSSSWLCPTRNWDLAWWIDRNDFGLSDWMMRRVGWGLKWDVQLIGVWVVCCDYGWWVGEWVVLWLWEMCDLWDLYDVRCGWVGDHPNSSGWDGHPNFERQSFWKVLVIWLESRWKVLGMVEWGVCGATCRWYLEDIQVISMWYLYNIIMNASWMQEEWIKIPGTQLMDSERPCGA